MVVTSHVEKLIDTRPKLILMSGQFAAWGPLIDRASDRV